MLFKNKKPRADGASDTAEKQIALRPTAVVLGTYILLILSKIIDLTLLNRDNEYLSVVVLQMMIFLIPAFLWCRLSGEKYIRSLRLTLPRGESIPIILAASLLMISGGILLSLLFGGLESLSSNFSLYDTFISKDDGTAPVKLYLILAYAALPALCEEFVYRGILCREYERGGVTRAIALSSIFFGMLHFDLPNLPVYIFSGVVLAMTMYATRSLLGAIVAHFLYNIFGLFGQPYINTLYRITGSSEFFVFILGCVFLASGALFCAEASRLYKNHLSRALNANYRKPETRGFENIKNSYLDVIKAPSAIACLALYIVTSIVSLIFN